MMTRIRLSQADGGYLLRLREPQDKAIYLVLQFLGELRVADPALRAQVGCDRPYLTTLANRIIGDEECVLSPDDLHIVHSALVVAENQFPSEESFHIRIGFYRENIAALARGLVNALAGR